MRGLSSFCALLLLVLVAGCRSPEDGRPRGDGHGGDGGNYVPGHVHPPSKIDGTKDVEGAFGYVR